MRRDTVPAKDNDLLPFATNISTRLTATLVAFGCTAGMATQLADLLSTFDSALAVAQNPETRGHSTIFAKTTAKEALVAYLRVVIRQIQGTSTVTDQQRTDLGINVRKTPQWPGEPGTAYKITATLNALGGLDLVWKCTNPASGTMYQVYRKLGAAGPEYIGGSGLKKLVDSTLPAGTSQVTYMIQAVRSTGQGAWASLVVNIGTGSGGAMNVASTSESPVKMAA